MRASKGSAKTPSELERRASETQERLRLWNVSQDLLAVANLQGEHLQVNPAWTDTLGWSESDLLGRSSEWLCHPDDREKAAAAEIGHLATGGKPWSFENHLRHKNGSYRRISWIAVADGDRVYAMGRDVTGQEHAERALQTARREITEAAGRTVLTEIMASIAHEISQPLTAIVTNGSVGLRWLGRAEPELDEVRAILAQIVTSGHRASEIIANNRALFQGQPHEALPLEVNDLVEGVLALVQGELERHQIVLRRNLDSDLPRVNGERVLLQQVVLNLIMNAVEAMNLPIDRRRLLSIATLRHESGDVLVTVSDCGTGIEQKDLEHIFDPFFTTKPQRLGIGLSICRSIVRAHGGRLWASRGSPHGSTFHVQLPIGD
jgi:PAS domain S-box-containing protein